MTRIACWTLAAALLLGSAMSAASEARRSLGGGVSYAEIARWDVARLNEILGAGVREFSGVAQDFTPATTGVVLYSVTYPSTIPEQGNRPTVASGLVAVPEGATGAPPLVSYQHGTVYGKDEVPSSPERSFETQLMIAQFAGQGYALTGADYFGLGQSTEPEGYMVKVSHQQATADMLAAARAVLADLGVTPGPTFLAGWSQGGFVTLALLEKLEREGAPPVAAATASAPVDVSVALNGFLQFPRPNDADWVGTLFILSAFSFESYYGEPGLARALIQDAPYEAARKAWAREPVDAAEIPTELSALIRPEFFDAEFFAASAYGRRVAETEAYRQVLRTPTRTYYGEADEAISEGLGRLAATYQAAMGAGNPAVEAISTGPTTHRGTFVRAVPEWKAWFDALAAETSAR